MTASNYSTVNASAIITFQHKGREIHILTLRNGWPPGACAQIGLALENASPALLKPDTFDIGELAVAFVRVNWDRPADLFVFGNESGKTFKQCAPRIPDYRYIITMRKSGALHVQAYWLGTPSEPQVFYGAWGDFQKLCIKLDADYDDWCEHLSNPGGKATDDELARHPLNEILRPIV